MPIVQAVSAKQFKADQPQADFGGQSLRSVHGMAGANSVGQEKRTMSLFSFAKTEENLCRRFGSLS
jgi:hypothetical protein